MALLTLLSIYRITSSNVRKKLIKDKSKICLQELVQNIILIEIDSDSLQPPVNDVDTEIQTENQP